MREKYSWESVSGHKARMPTMSDEELKSTCEYVPMNIVKDIINRDAKFLAYPVNTLTHNM